MTIRGTAIEGKVVYVTATAPYFLLIALLSIGLSLEGSLDGIKYFLVPKWERLLDYKVWQEAAIQSLAQGAAAWGGVITLASYNKFDSKVYRDAWMIPMMSLFTSILGGCALFSIVGFMAHKLGADVGEVAQASGPGIAFVVYPEAIAQLPWSSLWSAIFFLTLITVGIDTQFGQFETLTSGLMDTFSTLQRHPFKTKTVCAIFSFAMGLPICTSGGMYLYQVIDWYAAALAFTMVGFLEVVTVCYIYGMTRFCKDAKLMFGFEPSWPVRILWLVVLPLILGFLMTIGMILLDEPFYTYKGTYNYPQWAIWLGWSTAFFSIAPIPLVVLYKFFKAEGSFKEVSR